MANWFLDDPDFSGWVQMGRVARIQRRHDIMLSTMYIYAPHQTDLTIALDALKARSKRHL